MKVENKFDYSRGSAAMEKRRREDLGLKIVISR